MKRHGNDALRWSLSLLLLLVGGSLYAQEVKVERNENGAYTARLLKSVKTKTDWGVTPRIILSALLQFETGLNVYNGKEPVTLRFEDYNHEDGGNIMGLTYVAPETIYHGGATGSEVVAEGTAAIAFGWTGETPFKVLLMFTAENYAVAEAGVRELEEKTRETVKFLEALFAKGTDWYLNEMKPKKTK